MNAAVAQFAVVQIGFLGALPGQHVQVTEYILNNCDLTMLTRMKMRAQLVKDKIALLAGEKALKVATKLPGIVRKIIPIVQYANIVGCMSQSDLLLCSNCLQS